MKSLSKNRGCKFTNNISIIYKIKTADSLINFNL